MKCHDVGEGGLESMDKSDVAVGGANYDGNLAAVEYRQGILEADAEAPYYVSLSIALFYTFVLCEMDMP
jgi:hypothetical protein